MLPKRINKKDPEEITKGSMEKTLGKDRIKVDLLEVDILQSIFLLKNIRDIGITLYKSRSNELQTV